MQNNPYSEALMMGYNLPQKQMVSPQVQAYFNRLVDNLVNNIMQPSTSGAVTGSAIDKSGWGFAGSSQGASANAGVDEYDPSEAEFSRQRAAEVMQQYQRELEDIYRKDPKRYYEIQNSINNRGGWGFPASSSGVTGAGA